MALPDLGKKSQKKSGGVGRGAFEKLRAEEMSLSILYIQTKSVAFGLLRGRR